MGHQKDNICNCYGCYPPLGEKERRCYDEIWIDAISEWSRDDHIVFDHHETHRISMIPTTSSC